MKTKAVENIINMIYDNFKEDPCIEATVTTVNGSYTFCPKRDTKEDGTPSFEVNQDNEYLLLITDNGSQWIDTNSIVSITI